MTDYCVSSVYAEFGSLSTDAITMTFTHADLSSTKMYNVLLQQIPCDAEYKLVPIDIYSIHIMYYWYILCVITNSEFRAPTDCVQYFTGLTGSVANYGFGSGDLLINQEYTMCIRTEVEHHPKKEQFHENGNMREVLP